jgi:ribonuclease BN (tRNA processing enzyme)
MSLLRHLAQVALVQPNIVMVGLLKPSCSSKLTGILPVVSSILIQIPKHGNVLLDAGEGTWGQFVRNFGIHSFGSSNAWEALRNLKCIFISHIHADHHVGLANILSMRCRVCSSLFLCYRSFSYFLAQSATGRTSLPGCT